MSDALVKVEGLSKKFCRSLKKSLWYGLQDLGNELIGNRHGGNGELRPDEFWAVDNLSFELRRGECLGLIGHNGAGKTTLLRMLNGLIKPDRGRIEIEGRVGALIALGAGFNPILTGRENIYVNGSVLGLSKREINEKIDEIVDFADIDEFIDAPVQTYSSGMNVRLGFAIASTINPDVLLLDEVLAVGDVGFQIKCGHRIREIAENSAVIFVSHSMQYISSFCSRAILLNGGRVEIDSSPPIESIQQYLSLSKTSENVTGTDQVYVDKLKVLSRSNRVIAGLPVFDQGESICIEIDVTIDATIDEAVFILSIVDSSMVGVITFPIINSDGSNETFGSGGHRLHLDLGSVDLNIGQYSFLVSCVEKKSEIVLLRHQGLTPFRVHASSMHRSNAKIIRPTHVTRLRNEQ